MQYLIDCRPHSVSMGNAYKVRRAQDGRTHGGATDVSWACFQHFQVGKDESWGKSTDVVTSVVVVEAWALMWTPYLIF